ncbi:MAG: glycosyltransferase family protein [Bacteroidia bacterium]|nr:glycosyltransferase family protein [Bacteroidia bacterium]
MALPLPHIGIITQARMTSTRLPGKILKEVNNKTLLQYHIERLQKTGVDIAIATTINTTDDCVCDYAVAHNLHYHRGSEENVLSRFYETAVKYNYQVIVRVTSDCPLIDGELIKDSIDYYLELNDPNAYLSNCMERTFARGFDFEIFSFQLLKEAYDNATDVADLEHVTPYIWQNKSGNVQQHNVRQFEDNSHLRITVDTNADFELVRQLIQDYNAHQLSNIEIETILNEHPNLVALNAHIEQKKL